MFKIIADFDFFFYALSLWLLGFLYCSQRVYRHLSDSMPWQWFQGHVKGRAMVLSIAAGIGWPAAVIIKQFEHVSIVIKAVEFVTIPRSMRRREDDTCRR